MQSINGFGAGASPEEIQDRRSDNAAVFHETTAALT